MNLITVVREPVSPPLNLHSLDEKVTFIGPCHLSKSLGQKGKATPKVSLLEYLHGKNLQAFFNL